jgi:hypothetical protein
VFNIIVTFHSLFIIKGRVEETEERDMAGETYERREERQMGRDIGEETVGRNLWRETYEWRMERDRGEERQRGRYRGEETEGKRQRVRDRGEETEEKRRRGETEERDIGGGTYVSWMERTEGNRQRGTVLDKNGVQCRKLLYSTIEIVWNGYLT